MWALQDLVGALAIEIAGRFSSGLWVSVELNKALARFLRELFLLLHPTQMSSLVQVR